MPKWKLYLVEAAPIAIGVVFLLAITAAPNISLPDRKDTLEAIVKVHFWREIAFQRNIPKLLQQLSHANLKKSTQTSFNPVRSPVSTDVSRAHIMTVINIDIKNSDENPIEKTDWQTQSTLCEKTAHG
ncbi:MAG: hypothetical protein OXN17_08515 [Candidatus Poribacteria bacterium]|nr:hypothetical protein [Candidatus Poribacteria bacterium]MDE0502878.1 hypothetical protein [Candidatus Poribacteria bacterium]